jgi:hypothetical protein
MAYHPRSALSNLVNNTRLKHQTLIELLQLTYDGEIGKAVLGTHETLGDEILERIIAPNNATKDAPNIQLLQVFRLIQARSVTDIMKIPELSSR